MKNKTTVKRDNLMPTFIVRYWDVSEGKLKSEGIDTSSNGVSKHFAKQYCRGRIEHVQSGESAMFNSAGELLLFMEKYRV